MVKTLMNNQKLNASSNIFKGLSFSLSFLNSQDKGKDSGFLSSSNRTSLEEMCCEQHVGIYF